MTVDVAEGARARARERVRAVRLEQLLSSQATGSLRVKVGLEDLDSLDAVKTLLSTLNDAYAGAPAVLRLVPSIPVLAARCRQRAFLESDDAASLLPLVDALKKIGNAGLEHELLGVLEDLTLLSYESG